jgi:hypothetical protein
MFFIYGISSIIAAYYFTNQFYPSKMKQLKMKAAWYSIKTYCYCEEKVFVPLRLFINSVSLRPLASPKCIVFINANGEEMAKHTEEEFKIICLDKTIKKGIDYDFIIYKVLPKDEEMLIKYDEYKLLFDDHLNVTKTFKSNTNIKFLGLTLKINLDNENYKVPINFGRDNYYSVGNKVLGRSFINWFFKDARVELGDPNYVPYINVDTKYSISFIDQTMKCIELHENQCIRINEKDYSIICEEPSSNG